MHPFRDLAAYCGRLSLFVLVLLLAPVAVIGAGTIVIQPSDQDAFILSDQPNRINGAKNNRLRVEASPPGTKFKRSLVKFPLQSIPPGSTVTSAVVGVYATINASNPTLTHGLYRITEGWKENEVKWNNKPKFLLTPTATAVVGDSRGFKSFDVTTDVQSAINLCPTDHGWLIKDVAEIATNDAVAYLSNNEPHTADAENRPKITVEFTPPACDTDADCQDTNLCTTNEHCTAEGVCGVTPIGCDDGDPCTTDVCDCTQGCVHQPTCNDGFSCTIDTCDPVTLECTNTLVDSACVTDCSTGTCVADPDSTTIDPTTGCQIETTTPAGTPCSDGQICTTPDHCNGSGTCIPGPADCDNPVCGTMPICQENCDNCIDDNQNGLVDRDDPHCRLPDGGGQGAGDPKFRGKPIVRCQKAIRAAGSRLANTVRQRLQRCTDGVFLCLQQKPGDATCLAKARARCLKQTAAVLQGGPAGLDARLAAKINAACGPKKPGFVPLVSGADLCGAKGLGFENDLAACADSGSPGLIAALASALVTEHRCRAIQLFAADVPRANELLLAGGVDANALPCMIDGAEGHNLGLGKPSSVLKAVVGCQKGIGTAGARFVTQVLAAEQRCSEVVAQCIQTKPGNGACLTRAQTTCRKLTARLFTGAQSRELKLKGAIARACGIRKPGQTPRVALGDLRSTAGLGYEDLQSTCGALGVESFTSLDDVSECLVRHHLCRADQILVNQIPRSHELLELGGALQR